MHPHLTDAEVRAGGRGRDRNRAQTSDPIRRRASPKPGRLCSPPGAWRVKHVRRRTSKTESALRGRDGVALLAAFATALMLHDPGGRDGGPPAASNDPSAAVRSACSRSFVCGSWCFAPATSTGCATAAAGIGRDRARLLVRGRADAAGRIPGARRSLAPHGDPGLRCSASSAVALGRIATRQCIRRFYANPAHLDPAGDRSDSTDSRATCATRFGTR